MISRSLLPALVALLLAPAAWAQSNDDLRRVVLVNGDVYVGTVADEDADPIVVRTRDGLERSFPRSQVDQVLPLIRGRFFRADPVRTRFTIAPTARTLGGGEARADLYPSVTVGLSDRVDGLATGFLSFGTGAVLSPLLGVKAQVYATETAQVALGTSALFAFGDLDDDSVIGALAVPYVVATLGDETRAVTFGVGGAIGSLDGEIELSNGVVLGAGAEVQVNNGVKLFVEALGTVGEGEDGVLVIPGVRLFGDRFSLDIIGFIATDGEDLIGFAPIPARLSYRF